MTVRATRLRQTLRAAQLACGTAALCVAVMTHAQLPSAASLRNQLNGYLMKPLPSVSSIVGIPLPSPSPFLVVASFADDGLVANTDRGYAAGRRTEAVQPTELKITPRRGR